MIFNNDLIFIHIGKTGGMSCSEYLLYNLQSPVYNCHEDVFAEMKKLKHIDNIIPRSDIHRHCTLAEALEYIQQYNGKKLKDFKRIVAVIRHPYTLEYSFYNHLKKPEVRKRRKGKPHLLQLADGDFKNFVANAGYHRDNLTQDDFFRLNNEIPDCVELVRFEQLAVDFPKAVSPFIREGIEHPFPHRNRTNYQNGFWNKAFRSFFDRLSRNKNMMIGKHLTKNTEGRKTPNIHEVLTDEVKAFIYQKHKFMFDSGLYTTDI